MSNPLAPWRKDPDKATPQPLGRKLTQVGNGSDDGSGVESDDESDEDVAPATDPEKRRLAKITESHKDILKLFIKDRENPDKKSARPNFTGGKRLEAFKTKYRDALDAVGEQNRTLLHHIVNGPAKTGPMLSWLLKEYPELILQTDSDCNTALYAAIVSNKTAFVDLVLKDSPKKVEALQILGVDGTCLHRALESKSPKIMDMVSTLRGHRDDRQGDDGRDKFPLQRAQGNEDNQGNSPLRHVLGQRDGEDNTPLHIAIAAIAEQNAPENKDVSATFPSSEVDLVDLVTVMIREYPEGIYQRNKKQQLPYSCLGSAKTLEICTQMVEEMKKGYLRKFSHDEVIDLLYTDGSKELRIFFDLSDFSRSAIPATDLDKWGKHLQFETILQYVDLPYLSVEGGDDLLNPGSSDPETASEIRTLKGRDDFVKIFNWLRRKNGVQKILEVTVKDDENEPHCDEAIEMALKDFEVERLDWQKIDLGCDVLWNAARDVREVHLYSSGNNDILRGWSSKNGLARLPKLETVHLSVRKGLKTESRIAEHVHDFRAELQAVCPRIQLKEEAWSNKREIESNAHREAGPTPKHPWLDCMKAFAKVVQNNHRYFKTVAPEVKVAIIDDGIDSSLAKFQGRIADGRSYLKRSDKPERTVDYWVGPGGHGTEMARLVCQICPVARLYVIRLEEGKGESGERQIKVDSATKAIEWATRAGVHIISMSWSINKKTITPEQQLNLENKVRTAYQQGITMFCAASDLGKRNESTTEDDIPAAFGDPIKIGAAKADGEPWSWTGFQEVDFYLPGHDIVVDGYLPAKGQPQSGSSLATAIAAGLAALIQYCVGVADSDDTASNNSMRTQDFRAAFKKMCATHLKVPEVERCFGKAGLLDRPEQVKAKYKSLASELQARRPGDDVKK